MLYLVFHDLEFIGNVELQERYAVEVSNKFQILDQEPATKMYERFTNAIAETAKDSLEVIPKRKKDQPYSENKRIKQARGDMEKAYQKFVGSGESYLETYIGAKSNLNKVYEELMGEDLEKKIKEIKWIPIHDLILDIINKAYTGQELPAQWTISNIVPIPKSGDLTKTDNCRGISLSSVVAKVYNRMLLNRIRPVLGPLLRTNQNGFRERRTTVQQVPALRR